MRTITVSLHRGEGAAIRARTGLPLDPVHLAVQALADLPGLRFQDIAVDGLGGAVFLLGDHAIAARDVTMNADEHGFCASLSISTPNISHGIRGFNPLIQNIHPPAIDKPHAPARSLPA